YPFEAVSYNQLILKIVTEAPTPLLSLRPEIDPKLAEVIARAIARNRDERYASVAALALDLEPFAGGVMFRRTTAAPGTYTPRVSQPVLRGTSAPRRLRQERP